MLIPFQWIGLFATAVVFVVMFTLGLMLGREQIAAALQRRVVLAAVIFAVIVPVPALAVLAIKLFGLQGPVAVGIVLMAISPGAPVALRRALDAGGDRAFAPALHLSIVMLAVVTVPVTVAILDWIFATDFTVTPWHIGRQVFFAQLLPMALGAGLRAVRPALAASLEARLARIGNLLLLLLGVMVLVDLPPIIRAVGWAPMLAGVGHHAVRAGARRRVRLARPGGAPCGRDRRGDAQPRAGPGDRDGESRAARRHGVGDRLRGRPRLDDRGVPAMVQAAPTKRLTGITACCCAARPAPGRRCPRGSGRSAGTRAPGSR